MDKMKKLLSSPSSKKRQAPAPPKYFSVSLSELAKREGRDIPNLVTRICAYILKNGMDCEGIFRVNGNAKVVEKIKTSFDKTGDADLDEADDIMAVAGILKLFLRELPESVIPEHMTSIFVRVQQENSKNRDQCILKHRALLRQLPRPNYCVLKYICQFLVLVTKQEIRNKMSPTALGIVFGPNLFSTNDKPVRCTAGIKGLQEQGVTNHITLKFITEFDSFFIEQDSKELSPHSPNFVLKSMDEKSKKPAPPRPPPPKLAGDDSSPVPSPRKQPRPRIHDALNEDSKGSSEKSSSDGGGALSPRFSDEEFVDTYRSSSPFPLESDRSECGTATPLLGTVNAEVVEKAISSVITEHLFGEPDVSMSEGDDPLAPNPVPAPRRKKGKKGTNHQFEDTEDDKSSNEEVAVSVKQRALKIEVDVENAAGNDGQKPKKQRPKSDAFNFFETSGIIIGPAPGNLSKSLRNGSMEPYDDVSEGDSLESSSPQIRPLPRPRSPRKRHSSPERSQDEGAGDSIHTSQDSVHNPLDSDDSGLGSVQRTQAPLSSFKRIAGPKNRRNPSRQNLKRNLSNDSDLQLDHISEDDREGSQTKPFLDNEGDADENHNPSMKFLDIRHNGTSPDRSPVHHRKPEIPPLDLSILHEHGDGNEPITAEHGPSLMYQKAKSNYSDNTDAVISPRSSKLKNKKSTEDYYDTADVEVSLSPTACRADHASANPNTDVPPSPPQEQLNFNKSHGHYDEEQSTIVKQLTKKLQSYKRKIKQFEEQFEQERGYRPSQTDKAHRPEIKKYMMELAKARKELRKLKEEAEAERMHNEALDKPSITSEQNGHGVPGLEGGTMMDTLNMLLQRLADKRRDADRPEDLSMMTREQIQDEKLAVQKSLLHFENIHGRPSSKSEKELMRPLYDRYRNIKRLIASPQSPRDRAQELQSVPEDSALEFNSATPSSISTKSTTSGRDRIMDIPSTSDESHEVDDFSVTKDFHLLHNTVRPVRAARKLKMVDTGGGGGSMEEEEGTLSASETKNIHEMSVRELHEELQRIKTDKKRLRKVLREYEENFMRQTGRKVGKGDREPMEMEYKEYKQVKARLKLVDALLSKYDPMAGL